MKLSNKINDNLIRFKSNKEFNNNLEKKYLNTNTKKKSVQLYVNKANSQKISHNYKTAKTQFHGSFVSHNSINNNNKLSHQKIGINDSYIITEMNYKGIEEEIKCEILEMKNDCILEMRKQSFDGLELYKKKQINNSLTETKDSHNSKNKSKRLIKSKTNYSGKIFKKKNVLLKRAKRISIKESKISKKLSKNSDNFKEINSKRRSLSRSKQSENKSLIKERFRFYGRGGIIEDSYNENESDEEFEEEKYLINPETIPFLIYDIIIFIAALYSLIFIPYEITSRCLGTEENYKMFINYSIDILFIIDFFINFFFVEYYNKKDKLVKKHLKIIKHYLKSWFVPDLLSALPINIIYYHFLQRSNLMCYEYEKNEVIYYLTLLKCLKTTKIFKMSADKQNQLVSRLLEETTNNPSLNERVDLSIEIFLVIFGLHILSCIHIFIGNFTFPSWIFINEFQDFSLANKYLTSLYYLIQTMTTVGYGDISSHSFIEIIFRIILLGVGIICYSWLISNISNGINKQSYAATNFSNDCLLLESIRKEHLDLPFKIYMLIKHHLEKKHFHQNLYDKNLLINSLPYSLKNNLIFSMFKIEIEKFNYFKGISNTNFLSELLYHFSSVTYKKNEILFNENEIIEEIIFVKDGRVSLELPIDIENTEQSANEYLSDDFMNFAFNFDNEDNFKLVDSNISNHSITSLFYETEKQGFHFKEEILKIKQKEQKIFYLRIYDLHKNEDYGSIYMFYGKRSPFQVKVKSKLAKLYIIRRNDFANLCGAYKNIIKRTHKKEQKHLKSIKYGLLKTLDKFCISNGIKIQDKYKENIIKAEREIDRKNLPDILKKTSVGKTIVNNNEIDEDLKQTIRDFHSKIKILKASTLLEQKAKHNSTNIKKEKRVSIGNESRLSVSRNVVNEKKKTLAILMKERGSIQSLNLNNHKKSFNRLSRLNFGMGKNIIPSFQPTYIGDTYLNREEKVFNEVELNKALEKKIENAKQRISLFTSYSKRTNSNKSLLNRENVRCETIKSDISKQSTDTIKLQENDSDDINLDMWPVTINVLPLSLQNKIEENIKRKQIIKENNNKFRIDHLFVEIKNKRINTNSDYFENNINKNNYSTINLSNNNYTSHNHENSNTNYNSNIKYTKSKSEKINKINGENKDLNHKKQHLLNINKDNKKVFTFKNTSRSITKSNSLKLDKSLLNISTIKNKINNKKSKEFSVLEENKKEFLKNTNSKKDNDLINSDNLSSTSADSFEIKRSYKNLNDMTKGRYIKDKKLQEKTNKFVRVNVFKKRKNVVTLKSCLTDNLDIKEYLKEKKRKNSEFLLKKKKQMNKEKTENENNISKNDEYPIFKNHLIKSPKKNKNKRKQNKNKILMEKNENDNSEIRQNSLYLNPDETLSKLNISNNDIVKYELNREINENTYSINNNKTKKNSNFSIRK